MAYKIPILVFFSSLQIIDTISLRLCCFESAGSRAQRRAASGTQSTPGPAKPVTTPTKASALVTGFDEKTTFQLARRRRRRPKNNLKEGKEWADEKYFVDWLVNHVKQYPSNTPWSDNSQTVAYWTGICIIKAIRIGCATHQYMGVEYVLSRCCTQHFPI